MCGYSSFELFVWSTLVVTLLFLFNNSFISCLIPSSLLHINLSSCYTQHRRQSGLLLLFLNTLDCLSVLLCVCVRVFLSNLINLSTFQLNFFLSLPRLTLFLCGFILNLNYSSFFFVHWFWDKFLNIMTIKLWKYNFILSTVGFSSIFITYTCSSSHACVSTN